MTGERRDLDRREDDRIDPESPECRLAETFCERAMSLLSENPSSGVRFPSVAELLAGTIQKGTIQKDEDADLEKALAVDASANPFQLQSELRDLQCSIDPEESGRRLASRLGRPLDDLLRNGIERPDAFGDHPDHAEAFRFLCAAPANRAADSTDSNADDTNRVVGDSAAVHALRKVLTSDRPHAPGWLWARLQAELTESAQWSSQQWSSQQWSSQQWSSKQTPGSVVSRSEPRSRAGASWRLVGAAAALVVAAVTLWGLTGRSGWFSSDDPWVAGDDTASSGDSSGSFPRILRVDRPLSGFRSMGSIVEDIQDDRKR